MTKRGRLLKTFVILPGKVYRFFQLVSEKLFGLNTMTGLHSILITRNAYIILEKNVTVS